MFLSQRIDSLIQQAIERRIFPGAVVLVGTDRALSHWHAYGSTMYDDPESQPVATNTIYDVASLTKMFTATAALRLIEQGHIALEAPAARYLPELRTQAVQVFHLLTHTSGYDLRLSALREHGRAGLLAAVFDALPLHPPGSRVAYTNINSLLLGEVVARVAGMPLDAAISHLITGPLALEDTSFCPAPDRLPRIAPTELDASWRARLIHGSVHDESAHALGGVAGHAGLFSTAENLYRFCCAWLPHTSAALSLLSPELIAQATTNHTAALGLGCGLGWMIDRANFMGNAPPGTCGHTGFTGPALVIVPQQRLIVVVLCNRTYPQRRTPDHHAVIAAIVEEVVSS